MNPSDDARIQNVLRSSMPPIGDAELPRDLWPEMLKRINAEESKRVRFGLLDWVIAAAAAAYLIFYPTLIPNLLYHL